MPKNRSTSRRVPRPSPAMVVALVALLVAMSGTAVAASKVLITSSSQIKNGAISSADLSKKARKSLTGKAGKTGAAGAPGPAGANGTNGAAGAPGKDGANGSAVAYARISPNGTVTDSKGIDAANVVVGNAAGQFCFRNLAFVPHNIQVSIAYAGSGNAHMTTQSDLGAPAGNVCPAGTAAFVKTYDQQGGQAGEAFFVAFN